jgi:hypothetical protein
MEIWAPKYHTEHGTYEVWLHKRKVDFASPYIIIDFTKAKHLIGQRFAIKKSLAQTYPVGTNGKAPMYKVPLDALESWESAREVSEIAKELFTD